ncbi:hypothetical protein ACFV0O_01935 [Kitasatospora sp. NPDC059577]
MEEGVAAFDRSGAVFLYRREYPPGREPRTAMVRLDAVALFPFPPPDRL